MTTMTETELTNLIDQALAEFAHSECPYCQAYIGLDRYIEQTDIRKWLERRANYCPKCGEHWIVHDGDGACIEDQVKTSKASTFWLELELERRIEERRMNHEKHLEG